MKKGFTENELVLDLSEIKSTSQLVLEISSAVEQPNVKGKNVCLKLGDLDLKQSQLLSIKALVESMDASLTMIATNSEQTEASATSLGLSLSEEENLTNVSAESEAKHQENLQKEENVLAENNSEGNIVEEKVSEIDMPDFSTHVEAIITDKGIDDVYTEESTQEISEIIPTEHFEANFEKLALTEGLVAPEEVSKYIILETDGVLPEGCEEHSEDTKKLPTIYLSQNLRSGQTINYEGNVLLLGDAHPGSEIVAGGDITVWGILAGIAHAGAKGNISAKVRALKLNAIQLRIAGMYARRNDTLNVPYVQKSSEFTPEEAQIEERKIVIYKKLRRN